MLFALDILLDLHIKDGMVGRDFHLPVQSHTSGAEQLGAVQTLGRGLLVAMMHHLADVAERELGGLLSAHDLGQAGHQEVIGQLLHPS